VTGAEITFVVLDQTWRVVEPVERFLEYLRQEQYSPHTVRSYAGGLALWWSLLESRDQDWRHVGVDDLVRFVRRLRNRGTDPTVIALRPAKAVPASTVDAALTSVMSFYRFHAIVSDVAAARSFYVHVKGGTLEARGQYASFLGHIGGGHDRRVVGRRRTPHSPPPFLEPRQIKVIKDDAARLTDGMWSGDIRIRLLWTLLEETGLRLAEALLLRHRDWRPGMGTTAFIEVQPREDQRRRLRVKFQQYRRLYVSDDLDGLYGEYLFHLAEQGFEFSDDDDIFINLYRAALADWASIGQGTCAEPFGRSISSHGGA
jgi:integrase